MGKRRRMRSEKEDLNSYTPHTYTVIRQVSFVILPGPTRQWWVELVHGLCLNATLFAFSVNISLFSDERLIFFYIHLQQYVVLQCWSFGDLYLGEQFN